MHTNPEVLALMALGETDGTPNDRQHVNSCPACSEEVAELARIADVGRSSSAADSPLSAPSPQVWERISAELGFDQPGDLLTERPTVRHQPERVTAAVTPLSSRRGAHDPGTVRRSSAHRRFLASAVAAALALVDGVGVGIGYERQFNGPRERVIATAPLNALPEFAGATGTVEVTADGRGNRELVVRMTSPRPISGKAEVWLMDEKTGRPKAMGVMKDDEVTTLPIPPGMSLFDRPLVDISAEPANDTDPGHSGKSILRGHLV